MSESAEKKENFKKEIWSWVRTILIAILITFIVNQCVVFGSEVPTGSMEHTINIKDRIFTYRLAYLLDDPKRGDIVVFPFPDDESKRFVKRIIGLPNDTVEIIDGKVYINNSKNPLEEDYLNEAPKGSYGPFRVPKDHYFMLGDNRNVSLDSRFWNDKFVSRDKIMGKAVLKYYPKIETLK
ncbi:signal peptidase I [Paludicola sp. MB14-C6]|uniref:signal peptidase I n=1 Tax=Paludihabitans sp. MB14-C6 TaxID=3070656 RepID=UPI0027DAC4DA|nr:signal peptidase I [Paludicola sp. MB14-C6]WMJ23630.1 signal peptidase I [Paludicola sp. MB14-C6]